MIDFRFSFNSSLKKTVSFTCASLLLLGCFLLPARVVEAQQDGDETVRIDTSLVQLNVGVVDRQGRAITSLSSGDFAVYEEGVKQSIQTFEPVNAPFSLVLLLDMSGSTLSFRPSLKQAAIRFLDALS